MLGLLRSGAASIAILELREMADNMSVDKKEALREGSEDSMDIASPTPEAETGGTQENPAQQKRKGGRKPVCCLW